MSKATGLFLTVLLVSVPAPAELTDLRSGAQKDVTTVAEAKAMRDGTKVTLEGYILKELEDGHYRFRDDTGNINVEISKKVWGDLKLDPKAKVRLTGKIDRSDNKVRVVAWRLRILKTEAEPK